jgi:hypothetical protein
MFLSHANAFLIEYTALQVKFISDRTSTVISFEEVESRVRLNVVSEKRKRAEDSNGSVSPTVSNISNQNQGADGRLVAAWVEAEVLSPADIDISADSDLTEPEDISQVSLFNLNLMLLHCSVDVSRIY